MATVSSYWASVSGRDSRNKSVDISVRVNETDAQAWLTAADATARGLTDVGVLLNKLLGLSGIFAYKRWVSLIDEADNVTHPPADDNIYNFDKLAVSYKAGIDHYVLTIPGRLDTAYNVADDGVDVIISGAGASAATTDLITAFNATVKGKNGSDAVVERIYVQR